MTPLAREIIEQLEGDIIYHAWLMQAIKRERSNGISARLRLMELLKELLKSGQVEIGETRLINSGYVEFIAWKGTIEERITRAVSAVDQASNSDKDFAYWICLRHNVDRYE